MRKQNNHNIWKKTRLAVCVLLPCMLLMTACSDDELAEDEDAQSGTAAREHVGDSGDTWSIYLYLCGSDLESENAAATADLAELTSVALPENVQVVIETGGAKTWNNDEVDADYIERYLYDSEGLQKLDELPSDSMGESSTLEDFLRFAGEEYPADKRAVIFWNHGGGNVSGVCFDEIYDYDSLTLDEMYRAFAAVEEVSEEQPPYELVGFDACLMATVDTAYTLSDIASYMVASEETEPGCGWNYEGWLTALAEDPAMDGAALGTVICDSFAEQCEFYDVGEEITLSVTDLSKTAALFEAYEAVGREALEAACANPSFFAGFGRSARRSENYGGNTPEQGYTNLVDLYDLAEQSKELLPGSAQAVMDALNDCVVYKVNGSYREKAGGLSTYYTYNRDAEDYQGFCQVSANDAFPYLYGYIIDGALSEEARNYLEAQGYSSESSEIPTLEAGEEEFPVDVAEDGSAVMQLDQNTVELLTGIYFELFYVDDEEDLMLLLGRDNNIDVDWDGGTVRDNFWGEWGSIDGNLCYMEIVYEGEDYDLYSVPILLNDEEYNLRVAYDYTEQEYQILGARRGLEDMGGAADRNLRQLKAGDEITTIHYMTSISDEEEDFQAVPIDTFTVTEDTSFYPEDMGDGTFIMYFELEDMKGNTAYSQNICFTVENGEITTEVVEDRETEE